MYLKQGSASSLGTHKLTVETGVAERNNARILWHVMKEETRYTKTLTVTMGKNTTISCQLCEADGGSPAMPVASACRGDSTNPSTGLPVSAWESFSGAGDLYPSHERKALAVVSSTNYK